MKKDLALESGFTLLEIVIAITVIALLFGVLIPLVHHSDSEEVLRESARTLSLYARTARRQAMSEGRPYQIQIMPNSFTLALLNPVGKDVSDKEGENEINPPAEPPLPAFAPLAFPIFKTVTWEIERWTDRTWRAPKEERWVFQPSGLVEPCHFRFRSGEAWFEMGFNPLTGEVEEERYAFP